MRCDAKQKNHRWEKLFSSSVSFRAFEAMIINAKGPFFVNYEYDVEAIEDRR